VQARPARGVRRARSRPGARGLLTPGARGRPTPRRPQAACRVPLPGASEPPGGPRGAPAAQPQPQQQSGPRAAAPRRLRPRVAFPRARAEAASVEKVVTYLLRGGVAPEQVGVITPYEGQRAHVLAALQRSGPLSTAQYAEARARQAPRRLRRARRGAVLRCVFWFWRVTLCAGQSSGWPLCSRSRSSAVIVCRVMDPACAAFDARWRHVQAAAP
jgi:hypothetical protein